MRVIQPRRFGEMGRRLAVVGGALAAAVACEGTPNATFGLEVPPSLASAAAWYEIGVFPNGCPSTALLQGGIPSAGTFGRVAFPASSSTAPGVGVLPAQTYGVAAVARSSDCAIIGTGCTAGGVTGSGAVTITLTPVPGTPAGGCESGTVCDDAECVPSLAAMGDAPADAGASVSVGESCTLELVGQGPLADPLGTESTLLSAPAIAATPTGFLLAYREFDPTAGVARLTTIELDQSGGAAPPIQTPLLDACTGSPETDATALTFADGQGTIALSRPGCTDGPDGGATEGGLLLVTVDAAGTIQQSSFTTSPSQNLTLGQAHALASTPSGILLAYTDPVSEASFAATVDGTTVPTSPSPMPYSSFGDTANTAALVVGTSSGTAFLGLAASTGGTPDAVLVATEPTGTSLGGGTRIPTAWASAGGAGSRVLVASNGATGSSVAWSAFDMGTRGAVHTGTFSAASMGDISFADVAMAGDHAFFAAEVDQSLSLFAYEKASTDPLLLGELAFASRPGIPVGMLRDGLVAVAASGSLVAVVWGTGATLGLDDSVGGYAMFTCAP